MATVKAGQRYQDSDGGIVTVVSVCKIGAAKLNRMRNGYGYTPDTKIVWYVEDGDNTRYYHRLDGIEGRGYGDTYRPGWLDKYTII